jgi:hypothetical protein
MQPFFDRGTVTLRNETALPLRQLFLWSHGFPAEGEDRLGGEALPPGAARDLVLGMGHCNLALRAVFADGSEQRTSPLHVCYARELVLEVGPPAARVIPR